MGGWGLDGYRPTKSLNVAPMSVQKDSFRECKQQMSPGKMCVIGKDFGGPCPGDSGSPLVTYSKEYGPQLIGLVSNGAESCKAGLPGIFTRVSHYSDWINVAMQTARRVGTSGHRAGHSYNHRVTHNTDYSDWNNLKNQYNHNYHHTETVRRRPYNSSPVNRPRALFGKFFRLPQRQSYYY